MAKKAKVYTGTEWVDLAAATTDLSNYANLGTYQPTFRNFLINGGMDIAQRGTSLTRGSSDNYGLDRWYASGFGLGVSFTVSRSTSTPPVNFQYFQRVASTSTSAANMFISQSLETSNVIPLQNKVVTLSFRYRVPVNFTVPWTVRVFWSTATDTNLTPATSKTLITSKALTNTTSWSTDSLSFTVPATATALSVEFVTTNNVVNGAQFDFTGVQLELGSVATPFEIRPLTIETQLCQRYFQVPQSLQAFYFNASNSSAHVALPVAMRTVPQLAVTGATVFQHTIGVQSGNITPTTIGFTNSGTVTGGQVTFNQNATLASMSANTYYIIQAPFFTCSAEL